MKLKFCTTQIAALIVCICALFASGQRGALGAPVVLNHSETAQPGDVIYCEGTWGSSIQVKYQLITSTTTPNVNNAASLPPISSNAGNTHNSGSYVSFQIPSNAAVGLYAVWLNDGSGWSVPTYVNQAHGTHCSFSKVSPGFTFHVFGRNLILPGYTPSVRFVDTTTNQNYVGTTYGTISSSYFLFVSAPSNIPVGHAYNVIVNNGTGGTYGDSQVEEGMTVAWPNGVAAPSTPINGSAVAWNLNVPWQADYDSFCNNVINAVQAPYNVTAGGYTASLAQANTVGLQNAMNAASSAGGGVVYLPAGTYAFDCPQSQSNILYLPARVVVMGAGSGSTILTYGYRQLSNVNYEPSLFRRQNATASGLLNLGITNVGSSYGQLACSGWGDEWFLQGCNLNMGTAPSWDCNSSNFLLIENSTITESGDNTGQMNFHGETGVVMAGNTFTYNFGRSLANLPGGTSDVLFYNNHFTRTADKSLPNPNNLQGGAVDMYGSRVVFLSNTFDVGAGDTLISKNDGEQVLAEFVGAFPADSGQLTASTSTTLTDSTKSWAGGKWVTSGLSAELTTANSYVILVVSGPETGEWRYITASTDNTLTVDHPWTVAPAAGSEYMVNNWAANEWLVANNTFSNNLRGIWFGGASCNNVVANNTMTNDDGILIPATQGTAGGFAGGSGDNNTGLQILNPNWNMQVYNNTISGTPGAASPNPAQLTARFDVVNDYPTLLGTGILGLEVRRNILTAGTPNAGLDGGSIPAENYVNTVIQQFDPTPGPTYGWDLWDRPSVYDSTNTGILGSIFQGNASANQTGTSSAYFNAANLTFNLTGSAYYLGTGVYNTTIADPIFSNVGATVYDPNGTHFNSVPSTGSVIDYQAENGTLAGGTSIQSDSYASGGQLVGDFNGIGASCTINSVDGEAGGTHTLTLRYAVPFASSIDLYVNGTRTTLTLPATGGWYGNGNWGTVTSTIALNSGTNNAIALKCDPGSGQLNLDKITVQ